MRQCLRMAFFVLLGASLGMLLGCPQVTPPPEEPQKELITIGTNSLPDGRVGVSYSEQLAASNGNSAAYSWSVASGSLPAGLTLSSAGLVSGTPTTAGTSAFTVSCDDGENNPGSASLSLLIAPMVISPSTLPDAVKNNAYTQTLTAVGGTAPYVWEIHAGTLPAGLSLATNPDTSTSVISGTPPNYEQQTFTVRVTDSQTNIAETEYTVGVFSGAALEITTTSCAAGYIGGSYSVTLAATGGTGSCTWAVSSGTLPNGLSLNGVTGEISGTATTVQSKTFTVTATDTLEPLNADSQSLTIAIYSVVGISTPSCPLTTRGSLYSQALAATGGSGSYQWALDSGSLPDGLDLSTGGVISGTSTATGTFNFTVRVADTACTANTATQAYTIIVVEPVAIQPASLPSVGGNKAYSQTLTATGGGSYTWSVTSGSLPTGLNLNSTTGAISGYPGMVGTYNFTVTCADATYPTVSDTENFSITVTAFDWTMLVYMDGDNNLEANAIQDFNEMEAANIAGSGIGIVVLLDRVTGYDTSNGNWTNTRLYRIVQDTGYNTTIVSERLASTQLGLTTSGNEELNMGNPTVLTNFITYAKASFPASNYALVLWNHGSGWRAMTPALKKATPTLLTGGTLATGLDPKQPIGVTGGYKAICVDDTSASDMMYTQELGTAVSGQGMTVIAMDLCLGGMIEEAYEIRGQASYLIASEDLSPGDGYEYDILLNAFAATGKTAMNLVNSVVDAYQTAYASTSYTTISAIDLSQVSAVMTAFNTFSSALYSACSTSTVRNNVLLTLWTSVQYFVAGTPGDLNLDIWHMADVIQSTYDYVDSQAQALKDAISAAVVDEWHNATGDTYAHGLAVHFISLDSDGFPLGHSTAYWKNYTPAVSYPLAFVTTTNNWVPAYPTGPGLLYRLWYETLP